MNEQAAHPPPAIPKKSNGLSPLANDPGAQRLTDLLQTLTHAILWEADAATLQFTYVNERAVLVLGYPIQQWYAETDFWENHIHPQDRERALTDCLAAATDGKDHELVYRMGTASGNYVWLHNYVFLVRDNEERVVQLRGLMLDISEQKRVEHRLEAQYAVSRTLAESETLEDAAPQILCDIGEILDFDVGCLWLPNLTGQHLVLKNYWQADSVDAVSFIEASKSRSFEPGAGLPGRVWSTGEPYWIIDLEADENFPRASFAAAAGLRSGFGFPLRLGRDVLGIMEFFTASALEPDAQLLRAMDSLGRQIGQFIERRRAEQRLRRSQRELADFFDHALVGLHWVAADGTILWANRAELDLLGYAAEEYLGHSITEFHADREVIEDILRRLKAGEDLHQQEARLLCKDGSIKHVLIDANVLWEKDEFVHTRCVMLDITQRKRAEKALRENERSLRELVEGLGVALYTTDAAGRLTFYNDAAAELWGRRPKVGEDEWCGSLRLYWPDGRTMPHGECPMAVTLKENRPVRGVEAIAERPDGTRVAFLPYPTPIRDASGTLVGAVNVLMDITQRKQAEEALRVSELRYKSLFEYNLDAVFSLDLGYRFTSANPACEIISGYNIDELLHAEFGQLLVTEDIERARDAFERALAGEAQSLEFAITHKDGQRVDLNVTGLPIVIDGATRGVFGIAKDITRRKRAERALRESEERSRLAMDAGNMGAWEWNAQTGEVKWSEGVEQIHGLRPGTFAGTFEAYLQDVHPDDLERVTEEIQRALESGTHDIEYRIVLPNGSTRWLAGKGQTLRDEHGRPTGMIGVCMDITARKRVEEQLRLASEAKDEFLGMISHELRTPITTIYGGARLLRTREDELDSASKSAVLADIEQETERLHRIVEDLLVLSRLELDDKIATEPVLLQRVLAKAAGSLRHRLRTVEVDVPDDLEPIAAEQTYLEQVLRNLLSNADKYSPPGLPILMRAHRNGHGEVVVSVIDSGLGVSAEDVESIFERFFRSERTSKKVGGAGIGLTVCKRLIEAQSGRIWARPREEGGLEVSFALPLFKEENT